MSPEAIPFLAVENAVAVIRSGGRVVLVGTSERRSECTLTVAADHCSADAIAFMVTEGRGMLYLCLTPDRCEELALDAIRSGTAHTDASFMVSIEARVGVTGGVSVADRAETIRVACAPSTRPQDIVSPGHIDPLRARRNGTLERAAHPEAAVDLARLAGLTPAGVICGVLTGDGALAKPADLVDFAARHGVGFLRIADLVEYRRSRERLVERHASVAMPTVHGEFQAVAFRETFGTATHLALVRGNVVDAADVHVVVRTACLAGDALRSADCGCRQALHRSLDDLARQDRGVLIYLGYGSPQEVTERAWRPHAASAPPPAALRPVVDQMLAGLGVAALGATEFDASPRVESRT